MKRNPLIAVAKSLLLILLLAAGTTGACGQTVLDDLFSPSHLPVLRQSRLRHVSSRDTTGRNDDYFKIPAGETATIFNAAGPGVIARIWITVGASDPYYLRRILLRMYWDGELEPSVDVPLGDFFGTGFGVADYRSAFMGMTSGGLYCYFPMPFDSLARMDVVNETGQDISSFYYNIDYQELPGRLPSNTGYFHAWWHRDVKTSAKSNFVILDAEGEGQVVGCNLNMQGYTRNLSFLEGDEMVYVDGERAPSVNGTGTEDFFNSGWYFNRGEFSAPTHGLMVKVDSLSRIAAYRFMVGDAIPFKKSVLFTIEHGTENTEAADYSSTAYWYQREPHKRFPPMLKAGLRIPLRIVIPDSTIEAESLRPAGTTLQAEVEDLTGYGADWSGGKQLKIRATKAGEAFTMEVPAQSGVRSYIDIYTTKGPDYGNVRISIEGKTVAEIRGYSPAIIPGGKVRFGPLVPKDPSIPVRFVMTGKADASTGFSAGLDAFSVQPDKGFIPAWRVIGPFPNPKGAAGDRLGLDVVYLPEQRVNLKAKYQGSEGQPVQWQRAAIESDGLVDLLGHFHPNEQVVAYAVTTIQSPKKQELPLLLGSDDGVKVILNGKQILRRLLDRGAVPDQDTVSLDLQKGLNTLLLKVENYLGGYGFYARIKDPAGTLKYK